MSLMCGHSSQSDTYFGVIVYGKARSEEQTPMRTCYNEIGQRMQNMDTDIL